MTRKEMIRLSSIAASTGILFGFRTYAASNQFIEQTDIDPFHISFNKGQIDDLYSRIDKVKWPEISFKTGWTAGTNDEILRELVDYWRNEYDWFSIQENLNQLDHYRTLIEGERLHFVWYKDQENQDRFPILLLHGWPSSFLEFTYAAPKILKGINQYSGFNLVVPSLPGFTFSDIPQKPGVHVVEIANRLHSLMGKLGYTRYAVQGGDWGAIIAVEMARKFPEAVVGIHYVAASASQLPENSEVETERNYIEHRKTFDSQERAYYQLQATKPQTLAYALQDSPVGFLAWILEKYWAWSDHNVNIWDDLNKDDILTTTMLYWLTGHILSASRIYYETNQMSPETWTGGPLTVPTGYSRFPKEPWNPPPSLTKPDWVANLKYYKEMPSGGHFPALEEPELWSEEIVSFFSTLQ